MNDPHVVLGVDPGAEPEAIRGRYLELVRLHPPEKDAVRFAEIREAYERLIDPEERLKKILFYPPRPEDSRQLFGLVCNVLRKVRPTTAVLREMAAALDRRV